MSKRQNLLRLSITLLIILALAGGILCATLVSAGVKGGNDDVVSGNTSFGDWETPAFVDMPDISQASGFKPVVFADKDKALKMQSDTNYMNQEHKEFATKNIITKPEELIYVLKGFPTANAQNPKTFYLGADFVIADQTFLIEEMLFLKEGINLDGCGHSIVSNYITTLVQTIDASKSNFGGFLSFIGGHATLRNLNYYLAPSAALVVAQNENEGYALSSGASVDVTLGGMVGVLKGKVMNCNINIYGSIFGLRMQNKTSYVGGPYYRPRVGGVFGAMEGKVENCVMNVVGATVSASSHSNDDKYRTLGGISGIYRSGQSSQSFKNNVVNVAPSTIIGSDLWGFNSKDPNAGYNEVGVYFGNTGESKAQTGNYFINYNELYDMTSAGIKGNMVNYTIPNAVGYHGDGGLVISDLTGGGGGIINTYGASLFGDDFKYKVDNVGKSEVYRPINLHVNKRSWTADGGKTAMPGQDTTWAKSTEFADGYTKSLADTTTTALEFYKGVDVKAQTCDSEILINDSYSWNRLVSISGTAYFNDNVMTNRAKATVVDPFANLADPKTIFTKYRKNVVLDTKNGEFSFDSKAAPAFALYANIRGNNFETNHSGEPIYKEGIDAPTNDPNDYLYLPEKNKVDISKMTRSSGAIRNFAEGSLTGVTVTNISGIKDGGAVYAYAGGFIDDVASGVVIGDCVIDNGFTYAKTNTRDTKIMDGLCIGNTYYGGIFGHVGGTLERVKITSKVDLTLSNYARPSVTTYIGGFAGLSDGLTIKESIINMEISNISTEDLIGNILIGGMIAESTGTINVENSQISSQLRNVVSIVGARESGATGNGGYKGRLGGIAGNIDSSEATKPKFISKNARLDIQMSADGSQAENFGVAYMFQQVGGGVEMTNTLINLNDTYGFGDTPIVSANSVTATNTWLYNAGRFNDLKNVGEGFKAVAPQNADVMGTGINVISTIGYTANGNKGKLEVVDMHGLTVDHLKIGKTPASPDRNTITVDPNDLPNYVFEDVCSHPRFYVSASTSLYDTNRDVLYDPESEKVTKIYKTNTTNENEKFSKSGIGFYDGTTLGENENKISSATGNFEVRVEPQFEENVFKYYQYSIMPQSNDYYGKRIVAFYDIQNIRDAADWNQVARNINAGLSRSWIGHNIMNDISGDLISMGKDEVNGVRGNILGQEMIDPASPLTTRYPNITFAERNITPAGNYRSGLFGHISATGKVANINVFGTMPTLSVYGNPTNADGSLKPADPKANIFGGVVAGFNNGTIENVNVTLTNGIVRNSFDIINDISLGIIAGGNDGTINRVSVDIPSLIPFKVANKNNTNHVYVGGGIGLNNGTVSNTVINLHNINIVAENKGNDKIKVGGAIGYNQSNNINGVYLAAKKENFNCSNVDLAIVTHVPNGTNNGIGGFVAGYYDASFKNIPTYLHFDKSKGDDNLIKKVSLTGSAIKAKEASIKFALNINDATAKPDNKVEISVFNTNTFAISYFKGHGTASSEILSNDPFYMLDFSKHASEDDTAFRITINIVSNEINTAEDWNLFAKSINDGATYSNNTFSVGKFELGGNAFIAAENVGNAFQGTFRGARQNGQITSVITIKNFRSNKSVAKKGLFGELGRNGVIENIKINIVGAYDNTGATDSAAILVADNKGTIRDSEIAITSDVSNPRKISAPNAGIVAGTNTGLITAMNIDANIGQALGVDGLTIDGTNAGGLVGLNTKEQIAEGKFAYGNIKNIAMLSRYVVAKGANAGLIVGQNVDAAVVKTVVNTISIRSDYDVSTKYFIGKIDRAGLSDKDILTNIDNVWTVVNVNNVTIDRNRFSDNEQNNALFNVMYKYDLDNPNNYNAAKLTSGILADSVEFNATADKKAHPFYGYVNIDTANSVNTDNNFKTDRNQHGNNYAAVYAKKTIDNLADLKAIANYCGPDVKITGLVFELTDNIVLDSVPYMVDNKDTGIKIIDWETIPYLNQKIDGGQKYTIKTNVETNKFVDSNTIFKGFFDVIGDRGGLINVKIEMAASVGVNIKGTDGLNYSFTTNNDALIAKTQNAGTIKNVDVVLYGVVTAFDSTGIITANNTGNIEKSSVILKHDKAYNKNNAITSLMGGNAGVVAGVNSGLIAECEVILSNNTSLKGANLGVIVGENEGNGIIIGSYSVETGNASNAITIQGKMLGDNVGGVAGINDGIISNMVVNANKWFVLSNDEVKPDFKMVFGGVTAKNSGYIEGATLNFKSDTTVSKIYDLAGVAVNNSGYITDTVVNINAPFVATHSASGFVVNSNTGAGSLNGIGNAIVNSTININNVIKAENNKDAETYVAGVVLNAEMILNNVRVNINSQLVADYTYVLGNTISYVDPVAPVSMENVEGKTMAVANNTLPKLENANVIIDGRVAPTKTTNAYGTFANVVNRYEGDVLTGEVEFVDSWFVKNNTYSLPVGNIGFNEFKVVNYNDITIGKTPSGALTLAVTGTDGANVLEFNRGTTENDVINGGEVAKDDAINRFTFTPNASSTNRLIMVSNDDLTIKDTDSYTRVSNALDSADLYYDLPVILTADVDLVGETDIVPLGTMYGFKANFYGKYHKINVLKDIAGKNTGVFSVIYPYASVQDLIINIGDATHVVKLGAESSDTTGGLAGTIKGKISNVAVKFYNDSDESKLPTIVANNKIGAFAGSVESSSTIKNSWVFFQNGRYPAANKKMSGSSIGSSNEIIGFNRVNLGGVIDVDLRFADKKLVIEIPTQENTEYNWTDITDDEIGKADITPATALGAKAIAYNIPYDNKTKSYNNKVYNVSLIKTTIGSLQDLINLAENQRGFTINENETFTLTDDITVSVEEFAKFKDEHKGLNKIYAIGNNTRPFKSRFDGRNHVITIGSGITIAGYEGQPAGLFGNVAESAVIEQLKVVIDTNLFDGTLFAGGLAGTNSSSNIKNVIVKYNALAPDFGTSNVSFGAIFGDNHAKTLKGVYLIKNFKTDVKPVGNTIGLANTNVINVYALNNETFDLGFASDAKNTFTISAVGSSNAPFEGLIDVNADEANKLNNNDKIPTTDMIHNGQYAAVFIDTDITSPADILRLVNALNAGFNIKWLEYDMTADITITDFVGNSISHDKDNPFESVFNGNGHQFTVGGSKFFGTNAGMFGTIGHNGIVKNLIINIYDSQIGGVPTAEDKKAVTNDSVVLDESTERAGVVAGRNEGIIENVVVNNLGKVRKDGTGLKLNGTISAMSVVGDNTGSIINTWLVQPNQKQSAKVGNTINVVEYVGVYSVEEKTQNGVVINTTGVPSISIDELGNVSITPSFDKAFIYNMDEAQTPAQRIVPGNTSKGNRYFVTSFDLVINSDKAYRDFVDIANNPNRTSLVDVVIKLNGLTLEDTNKAYYALGTEKVPFDGIIDGQGTKLVVSEGATFAGDKYAGIFGLLDDKAVIKNIDISMSGNVDADRIVYVDENDNTKKTFSDMYLGVVAYNRGTIQNVIVRVTDKMAMSANTTNVETDVAYNGKVITGALVAVTETKLNNVWYVKNTAITMEPSTTNVSVSGINVMTVVGKDQKADKPNESILSTAITITTDSGVQLKFTGASGNFYREFNTSPKLISGKTFIANSGTYGQVYELVNVAIVDQRVVLNNDVWETLAVDTKGGYNFSGITFELKAPLTLTTSAKNALGVFGGKIVVAPDFANAGKAPVSHIIIVNDEKDKAKDFALIDVLKTGGSVDGVNIEMGKANVPVEMEYTNTAIKPLGLIINENNGTISGSMNAVVDIYNLADVDGKISRVYASNIAILVGTNNGTISDYTMNVAGQVLANNAFGFVAVANNGDINNITINVDGAKIAGNVGHYSFGVAKNNINAKINGIRVNIGEGSYINANRRANNHVAVIAAKNQGNITNGFVEFKGAPDEAKKYFLSGKMASFFVGDNTNGKLDNLVAKAINIPSIECGQFVKASAVNNAYDFHNGSGTNVWIIVDDSDITYNREVMTGSANIIKVIGKSVDIEVTADSFIAKKVEEAGSEFNGWFDTMGEPLPESMLGSKANILARGAGLQDKRIEAIFLNTIINDEADWHELAMLVNTGKNIKNVLFKLGQNNIELNGNITPVGTREYPFMGKIDGQNNTIIINGEIVGEYAGLFGYAKDATIANINVIIGKTGVINGSQSAGTIVGTAIDTVVGVGTFNPASNNAFTMRTEKQTEEKEPTEGEEKPTDPKLMNIIVNGNIVSDNNAGGIIGHMNSVNGKSNLSYVVTINNGVITSNRNESKTGGAVANNNNSIIFSVTVINNNEISGGIVGGIIGYNNTSNAVDEVKKLSVISSAKKEVEASGETKHVESLIYGKSFGGALVGQNIGALNNIYIEYYSDNALAGGTKALANFASSDIVVNNTWILTSLNADVYGGSIDSLDDRSSIRVMRTAHENFGNIVRAVDEVQDSQDVIIFKTTPIKDHFDYWKYSNGVSLYHGDEVQFGSGFMTPNGIKKIDGINFDITLEQRNTIENIDHLRALNVFSGNDLYNKTISAGTKFTIANDMDITESNLVLDMVNNYTIDGAGHIVLMNSKLKGATSVYTQAFTNGTITNTVFANVGADANPISETSFNGSTVTNVTFVEGMVYRTPGDKTSEMFTMDAINGKADQFIDSGNVTIPSSKGIKVVTRDYRKSDKAYDDIIVGNVPMVVEPNSVNVVGYTEKYSEYNIAKRGNITYYFIKEINNVNAVKAHDEFDYLLNSGFTFAGKDINDNEIVIKITENVTLGRYVGNDLTPLESMGATGEFKGILDGEFNTLEFLDGYKSLFAKVGEGAVIKNFVVKVNVSDTTAVFQGATGTPQGTMEDIVIINDSTTTKYEEADITYNKVLVVQGDSTVANNNFDDLATYTDLYELVVNTNASGALKKVSEVVNVTRYDNTIAVRLNKIADNMMFGGFYGVAGKVFDTTPIKEFANGVKLSELVAENNHKHNIVAYVVSNKITTADNWNQIAGIIGNVNTGKDTILIGADKINLTGEYTMASPVITEGNRMPSATIDGQNNTIIVNEGTITVFNGYNGVIKNLVINAYESGLTKDTVISNFADTTFENVIIITKKPSIAVTAVSGSTDVANNGKAVNIVAGDGLNITTNSLEGTISIATTAENNNKFLHITDDLDRVLPIDNNGIRTSYSDLKFLGKKLSNSYTIELTENITNGAQLESANLWKWDTQQEATKTVNIVPSNGNTIIVEDDMIINNPNLTINANGNMIKVAGGYKLTLTNGATLINAVTKGIGTLIVKDAKLTSVLVLNKYEISGTNTMANVWLNTDAEDATIDDTIFHINISEQAFNYDEPIFTITFVGDATTPADHTKSKFTLTMANGGEEGNEIYYIGQDTTLDLDKNGANKNKKIEYISSHVDGSIVAYNALLAIINANESLRDKIFYLDSKLEADTTALTKADKPFVLDANGNEIIITIPVGEGSSDAGAGVKTVSAGTEGESGSTPVNKNAALANITIVDAIVEIKDGNGNFAGTIGDKTIVIAYVNANNVAFNLAAGSENITVASGATNYHIVNIYNYGVTDNNYSYGGNNIEILTTGAFMAKKAVSETELEDVKMMSVYDLRSAENKVTDVKFYLPVKVSVRNNSDWKLLKDLISNEGKVFPQYALFDGNEDTVHTLPINVANNVILTGYTINDIISDNHTTTVKYTLNKRGEIVNIILDIAKPNPSNVTTEYRVDPMTNEYSTTVDYNLDKYIAQIRDTMPGFEFTKNYSLVSDGDYLVTKVDANNETFELKAIGNVGTYERRFKVMYTPDQVAGGKIGEGAESVPTSTQVGYVRYRHTITPYNLDNRMLKIANRPYDAGDKSASVDKNEFFNTLPQNIQDALADLVLVYTTVDAGNNKEVTIKTKADVEGDTNFTDIAVFNAIDANYVIKEAFRYKGTIDKLNVTITFDGAQLVDAAGKNIIGAYDANLFTIKFNHNAKGATLFSGVTEAMLKKMMDKKPAEGKADIVANTDIKKINKDLPYFYIRNNGMLNVSAYPYEVVSNIAGNANCNFTVVLNNTAVKVEQTEYTIKISNNTATTRAEKNYLAKVDMSNNYFNAIVVDANGNDIGIDVGIKYIWDSAVVKNVGGALRFVAKPDGTKYTIMYDPASITLKNGNIKISATNYTIKDFVVGNYTINNMNLNAGLTLDRDSVAYTGKTPTISASLNHILYNNVGIKVKAEFVDQDVKNVGEYDVKITLFDGNDDITQYVIYKGDNLTPVYKDVEKTIVDYYTAKFNIDKKTASINLLDGKNFTYGGIDLADNDTFFFRFRLNALNNLFIGDDALDMFFTFEDAKGVKHVWSQKERNKIDAGTYKVTFDPNAERPNAEGKMEKVNKQLTDNFDIIVRGMQSATLTVDQKAVDVTLTFDKDNLIYGDIFAGHSIKLESRVKEGNKITIAPYNTECKLSYKDAAMIVGEAILNAGQYKFNNNSVEIEFPDGNHKVGKLTVDSVLNIAPKPVKVSLKPGINISKQFGQLGKAESALDSNLIIEGLVKDEDLETIKGVYNYVDKIGTQTVTLANIESVNYIMENAPIEYKGIINIIKATVKAAIQSVLVDEKTNTTLVTVQSTVNGKKTTSKVTLQGTKFTPEEISTEVNNYLVQDKGYVDDSYTLKVGAPSDMKVKEYTNKMSYIVLGIVALCLLAGIAMLIVAIVNAKRMPKKFNQDFNFSREPGAKDLNTLMKGADKRRNNEYKAVTKDIAKAAKKGNYYNIEDALFPEIDIFADLDDKPSDESGDAE